MHCLILNIELPSSQLYPSWPFNFNPLIVLLWVYSPVCSFLSSGLESKSWRKGMRGSWPNWALSTAERRRTCCQTSTRPRKCSKTRSQPCRYCEYILQMLPHALSIFKQPCSQGQRRRRPIVNLILNPRQPCAQVKRLSLNNVIFCSKVLSRSLEQTGFLWGGKQRTCLPDLFYLHLLCLAYILVCSRVIRYKKNLL